ncbi:4-hydroxy-tetrahydrodipicolinate synthase [invertebrate metagenome]|uniref:4-hydroxy-tetrahydrodipicolinate synthase n=1 Tax=invertebrate metagenome TaxID=1711999 RepID=A0A2H9TA21_9ZZZZ
MITGSLVALATPMQENGELDWARLHDLVEWHINEGTDGILVAGTSGESATLTEQEQVEMLRRVVDQVKGRVSVIAGTGTNATQKALHMTAEAKTVGVDACLLVTPYYNKPTQEGLYQHYKTIAQSVDIPQILYNVPGRTGVDMLPETVARLAKLDNIVGIKEAKGQVSRIQQLLECCPVGKNTDEPFAVYSGDDNTGMESMLVGGHGVISVTSNVAPALMHAMCVAAMKGNREEAQSINDRLQALHTGLFVESNPIPVKWALNRMGQMDKGIRLPLTWLAADCESVVADALQQAGLI